MSELIYNPKARYLVVAYISYKDKVGCYNINDTLKINTELTELVLLDIKTFKLSSIVVDIKSMSPRFTDLLFGETYSDKKHTVRIPVGFPLKYLHLKHKGKGTHKPDIFEANGLEVHTLEANEELTKKFPNTLIFEQLIQDYKIEPIKYSFKKINGIPTILFKNCRVESNSGSYINFIRGGCGYTINASQGVSSEYEVDTLITSGHNAVYKKIIRASNISPYFGDEKAFLKINGITLTDSEWIGVGEIERKNLKYSDDTPLMYMSTLTEKELARYNAIGGEPDYIFYYGDVTKPIVDMDIFNEQLRKIRNTISEEEVNALTWEALKINNITINISQERAILNKIEDINYTYGKERVLITWLDDPVYKINFDNEQDLVDEMKDTFLYKLAEVIETEGCKRIAFNQRESLIDAFGDALASGKDIEDVRKNSRAGFALAKIVERHLCSEKIERMLVECAIEESVRITNVHGFRLVKINKH